MTNLRELLGQTQTIERVPSSKELMDHALRTSVLGELPLQFIETTKEQAVDK